MVGVILDYSETRLIELKFSIYDDFQETLMLFIYPLLAITCLIFFLLSVDADDEIHHLAAISGIFVALAWLFLTSPLVIKLLVSGTLMAICYRSYVLH